MATEIVGKSEGAGGGDASVSQAVLVEKTTEKKKKKKHKYSRGGKVPGEAVRGARKATMRVSKAVAKGISAFYDRSEKSGRKRRDGAIRDVHKNVARSLGTTLRVMSKAPNDLVKKLPRRLFINPFRAGIRIFSPFGR